MTGNPLNKVRTGDPLKIPASAYNAFVDTAIAHQGRERNTIAEARRELNQRGVVLVRNDSGIVLPAHHALAITGVLIEPDTNDDERTFQSRTPLKGNVADSASPPLAFVVTIGKITSAAAGPGGEACEGEEGGGGWGWGERGVAPVDDVLVCPCGTGS